MLHDGLRASNEFNLTSCYKNLPWSHANFHRHFRNLTSQIWQFQLTLNFQLQKKKKKKTVLFKGYKSSFSKSLTRKTRTYIILGVFIPNLVRHEIIYFIKGLPQFSKDLTCPIWYTEHKNYQPSQGSCYAATPGFRRCSASQCIFELKGLFSDNYFITYFNTDLFQTSSKKQFSIASLSNFTGKLHV